MADVFIKVESIPSFSDYNPRTDAILKDPASVGLARYQGHDNQSPAVKDPANWMIFDPGVYDPIDFPEGDFNNSNVPFWLRHNTVSAATNYRDLSSFAYNNPGATYPEFVAVGADQLVFSKTGGPRNKAYGTTNSKTFIQINNFVPNAEGGIYQNTLLTNQAWKEGSLEFTIKPTKSNCTLVSGALLGDSTQGFSTPGTAEQPGKQVGLIEVNDGISTNGNNGQKIEVALKQGVGPGEEKAIPGGYDILSTSDGLGTIVFPKNDLGITLTNAQDAARQFKIDLVNGVVRVSYEIFFGGNKKYLEFFGKTNLVDGNWHHLIINKPSFQTEFISESQYGGDGCMEIWVDGQLENRSFEITTRDILPTPQILFNDQMSAGVLNYRRYSTNPLPTWIYQEIEHTGYAGGIRDYIFRQSLALSPHLIKLNYIYAMLNTEQSKIFKATDLNATANIVNPIVTTSKPKVLKLYWNQLLNDPTKNLNGLELDDTYDVFSYSVTHKNLLSSSQTFNLDLNDPEENRKYFTNVRAAVGKNVFIHGPAILMTANSTKAPSPGTTGFVGRVIMIDTYDDSKVIQEAVPAAWYINNLLIGGVNLVPGDRVLLFGQNKQNENGIWIYRGGNEVMQRPTEISAADLQFGHVYVEQGTHANKTFVQTEKVTHIRKGKQVWKQIDNESSLSTLSTFPIFTTPWTDAYGNQRFINVNSDIDESYKTIVFMNYPEESNDLLSSMPNMNEILFKEKYKEFIDNLKTAVNNGKSIFISSPTLAVDFGITSKIDYVPQLLETSDAQSASISPFESGEPASNYYDTHRNIKYKVATLLNGLTDKPTYIMTDFVAYSPNRTETDYHIKYLNRPSGLLEGDEFYIPGLTLIPETLNENLPGYKYNQKNVKDLPVIKLNKLLLGSQITKLSTNIYNGSTAVVNPYNDDITTVAGTLGSGKFFVNLVEDSYAFSRSDYNKAKIQNVTIGQNAETALTAAWQYSTKRLNKKNLYDFSDVTNLIGQTTPTNGGGGAFIQAQSHCSNGIIRKNTNLNDLRFQSDLYADETEEEFSVTEIPTLSMTWLGLQWLKE